MGILTGRVAHVCSLSGTRNTELVNTTDDGVSGCREQRTMRSSRGKYTLLTKDPGDKSKSQSLAGRADSWTRLRTCQEQRGRSLCALSAARTTFTNTVETLPSSDVQDRRHACT